ncbi:putative acetylglutamate kinase [Leptospira ryugenii]|uniref:Putative acetylglutamate kinase n=1 Tax=Leptospira ryugenii TaxID=1917863 RepID=A0A2P2DX30_9LEPT|nr:acetylglutamate kinase [Leptospira ryugenii]GBF49181.1 putative acetylglutamate kinase [Leptospira ryugenii]
MESKDILAKVFEITRDPRDGLHFLQEFKSLSPESFALLYADTNTIFECSEALFSDIKLLSRLDLYPVVFLEEESFEYIKLFFQSSKFQDNRGIGFAFEVIPDEGDYLGNVKSSIRSKKIPVILWQKKEIGLVDSVYQIINALQINKVIQLHHEGPIYEEDSGKVISLIPTGEALERYKSNFAIEESNRDLHFIQFAEKLIELKNDPRFSVVLTSPYTLLRELFTVKGSGTLVKKENKIYKFTQLSEVDTKKLFQLIETSFRKRISPHFLASHFDLLYLEENYQGCAWLNKTQYGYLLSKFAVNETARGAGVGRDIWDLISVEAIPLFWRSKTTNTINKWYMKVAQGIEKDEQWYYYWLGLDRKLIPNVIEHLKTMPEDFIAP